MDENEIMEKARPDYTDASGAAAGDGCDISGDEAGCARGEL